MSNLFDLNDRIFAAMDELDAAKGEDEKKIAIENARTKAVLFNAAISNAGMIARLSQMQEAAMDGLAMQVGASRMLLGQPDISVEADVLPELPEPEFDAVSWLGENARDNWSISVIREKLYQACGKRYDFDELRALCDDAGVAPKKMGQTIREAEAERYASMPRGEDGARR